MISNKEIKFNCTVIIVLEEVFDLSLRIWVTSLNYYFLVFSQQKADSYLHSMLDRTALKWTSAVAGPGADTNGLPLPSLLLHVLSEQWLWCQHQGTASYPDL